MHSNFDFPFSLLKTYTSRSFAAVFLPESESSHFYFSLWFEPNPWSEVEPPVYGVPFSMILTSSFVNQYLGFQVGTPIKYRHLPVPPLLLRNSAKFRAQYHLSSDFAGLWRG